MWGERKGRCRPREMAEAETEEDEDDRLFLRDISLFFFAKTSANFAGIFSSFSSFFSCVFSFFSLLLCHVFLPISPPFLRRAWWPFIGGGDLTGWLAGRSRGVWHACDGG